MLLTLHILIAHLSLPCLILSSPHEPPHHSLTPRNPLAPFTAPSPFTAGAKDDASLLAATTPPINCNAARFGAHVRVRSARNALAKIPRGDRTMSIFAMRQVGHSLPSWVHILPYRFMSGDGLASIEISTKNNELISDNANWAEIHAAADAIIQICVSGSAAQGGRAIEVGVRELLTVTVSPYDNSNIRCFRPPRGGRAGVPPHASCASLLGELPWDERQFIWGNELSPLMSVIKLPMSIPSVDQQCNLFVSMSAPAYESMRWTDLWGASVAALEMCVKQGMLGSGVNMGEARKITFQLVGLQATSDGTSGGSHLMLGSKVNGSAIS
ncbi:hypothetical protein XPA_005190 [Xanthoria parietina]